MRRALVLSLDSWCKCARRRSKPTESTGQQRWTIPGSRHYHATGSPDIYGQVALGLAAVAPRLFPCPDSEAVGVAVARCAAPPAAAALSLWRSAHSQAAQAHSVRSAVSRAWGAVQTPLRCPLQHAVHATSTASSHPRLRANSADEKIFKLRRGPLWVLERYARRTPPGDATLRLRTRDHSAPCHPTLYTHDPVTAQAGRAARAVACRAACRLPQRAAQPQPARVRPTAPCVKASIHSLLFIVLYTFDDHLTPFPTRA